MTATTTITTTTATTTVFSVAVWKLYDLFRPYARGLVPGLVVSEAEMIKGHGPVASEAEMTMVPGLVEG